MPPLAHRPLRRALVLALVAALTACRDRATSPNSSAKTSVVDAASTPAVSPTPTPAEALAAILGEKNALLREHLLAGWALPLSFDQVFDTIAALPEFDTRASLLWLLTAKLDSDSAKSSRKAVDLLPLLENRHAQLRATPRADPSLSQRLRELAPHDPESALNQALAARLHPADRQRLLEAILVRIAEDAPENALARLAALPELNAPSTRKEILLRWARNAPDAALAWLEQNLPPSKTSAEVAADILRTWARTDPQAALDHTLADPDAPANAAALPDVFAEWIRAAPAESAAWLAAKPEVDPALLRAAVKSLSASHPALVADLLARFGDATTRRDLMPEVLDAWHATDPRAAFAWFASRPRDGAWLSALAHGAPAIAERNLADALALARLAPPDANLSQLAQSLAFTARDPAPVLAWLLTLGDTTPLDQAFDYLLPKLGHTTPEATLAFARTLPTEHARQAGVSAGARQLLATDPARAARFLQQLPADEARLTRAAIAFAWADTDRQGAQTHAATLPPGKDRDTLAAAALEIWSRDDPSAALAWAIIQPWTGPQSGLGETFNRAARSDPAAATAALAALPSGPARDNALLGLLNGAAERDPATAARALTSFGSPDFIAEHAHRVLGHLIARDQAAALAWLRTLPAGPARGNAVRGARSYLRDPSALDSIPKQ